MGNAHMLKLHVTYPPIPAKSTNWKKFKSKCYEYIQVSPQSPATIEYFKSEVAILNEKKRQYEHFRYIIHPLSKFNYAYQILSFFLYLFLVYFKAFDFGFIHLAKDRTFHDHIFVLRFAMLMDILALLNVALQFCIGFCNSRSRTVELSRLEITKRYIYSGHFVCDILSSCPRVLTYQARAVVRLTMVTLTLLKLRRISTVIELIQPTAHLFKIKSSSTMFLCGFFIVVTLVMHVMTCFHVGIPQYRAGISSDSSGSWADFEFVYLPISVQYMMTFFRCAQYTFLIQIDFLEENINTEEVIFSVINYLVGKLLVVAIWIVLLFTFVSHRMLKVKFQEIMTELGEYMLAKKLPHDLRQRLITYYKYKYQNMFFNESLVKTVLSENLKREIDVFLCKSLIQHVSIFRHVSPKIVKQVITYLVPQIFLPNDMIIQSGTTGDSMYFIESGTVAVYTPSGREVCHLQDGAYFGEISILMTNQKRPSSIIAVEITRVYILQKQHFHRCFPETGEIYKVLMEGAEKRIMQVKSAEEEYKSGLFKTSYTL